MKKRISVLLLAIIGFVADMSANRIWYFCSKGRVDIYIETTITNPITHESTTSLVYCCSGGGCPTGDKWYFATGRRGADPDWAEHEATEDEYNALDDVAPVNTPPSQTEIDSLVAVLDSAGWTGTEKWVDPLKIDQDLAGELDLYNIFEIYAPVVYENPSTNKKIKFDVRSNTGNDITIIVKNSITNVEVYNNTVSLDLGQNTAKEITVGPTVTGTFIFSMVSGINTINRTVIIQ